MSFLFHEHHLTQNFKMRVIETHIVTQLTVRIRIQEYGPLVFKTLPTRSSLKKAIKKKLVKIDSRTANTSDFVEIGQTLEVFQEDTERKSFNLKLKTLFEDSHFAVIDKPSGYPTSGNYFKTIENALESNLETSLEVDALQKPMPVHRLDNPTSGVLIIAKTKRAQVSLNKQFQLQEIKKTYLAILKDTPPSATTFTKPIEGKTAVSHLKSLEIIEKKEGYFSLVHLTPETGRTHQLRIHCAQAGFPIVGDTLYGSPSLNLAMMLHAFQIELNHPITGLKQVVTAETPKRFKKFLNLS